MSGRREKKSRKSIIAIILLVVAVLLLLRVAFAWFTDYISGTITATAGTVRLLDDTTTQAKIEQTQADDPRGTMGQSIPNWNPGDVNDIEWKIQNDGNKSIITKNSITVCWDAPDITVPSNIELVERGIIYMFPRNISDANIKTQVEAAYSTGTYPPDAIPTTSIQDIETITATTGTRKGIRFMFLGDVLNGKDGSTGQETETGATSDNQTVTYKIAFAGAATGNAYQGLPLYIEIKTDAIQYRNTNIATVTGQESTTGVNDPKWNTTEKATSTSTLLAAP